MTTEEELNDLRKQLKRRIEEKRVTAFIFGLLSVVALSALVYGFFQQTAANKERFVSQRCQEISEKEISTLKQQILLDIEKIEACAKVKTELQASMSKSGK